MTTSDLSSLVGLPPNVLAALAKMAKAGYPAATPSNQFLPVQYDAKNRPKAYSIDTAQKQFNLVQDEQSQVKDPFAGMLSSILYGGPGFDWSQLGAGDPTVKAPAAPLAPLTTQLDSYANSDDPVMANAASQVKAGVPAAKIKGAWENVGGDPNADGLDDSGMTPAMKKAMSDAVDTMIKEQDASTTFDYTSAHTPAPPTTLSPIDQTLQKAGLPFGEAALNYGGQDSTTGQWSGLPGGFDQGQPDANVDPMLMDMLARAMAGSKTMTQDAWNAQGNAPNVRLGHLPHPQNPPMVGSGPFSYAAATPQSEYAAVMAQPPIADNPFGFAGPSDPIGGAAKYQVPGPAPAGDPNAKRWSGPTGNPWLNPPPAQARAATPAETDAWRMAQNPGFQASGGDLLPGGFGASSPRTYNNQAFRDSEALKLLVAKQAQQRQGGVDVYNRIMRKELSAQGRNPLVDAARARLAAAAQNGIPGLV